MKNGMNSAAGSNGGKSHLDIVLEALALMYVFSKTAEEELAVSQTALFQLRLAVREAEAEEARDRNICPEMRETILRATAVRRAEWKARAFHAGLTLAGKSGDASGLAKVRRDLEEARRRSASEEFVQQCGLAFAAR